jgi:2-haloalkanoic acid dehalogenase type II
MADRWATFDCYGTLIDWEGGMRAAFTRIWPDADADRLVRIHHTIEPMVQEVRMGGQPLPYREVLRRCLVAISAIEGRDLPFGLDSSLADSLPQWPPFPDVTDSLAQLRTRGWRLAILSNIDPDLLPASIEQIGVRMDLTITAADAGSYKPQPGHWERFFERSKADRNHLVHVAASPFHDLRPAAKLGLKTVWINRLRAKSRAPRDAELPDLARLPDELDRLMPAPE